ncbi:acyltransferase family protein [Clostridium sp. SHJSY1]|nr:acyltransferase family protein [Clostridium sp. SHJSY1]
MIIGNSLEHDTVASEKAHYLILCLYIFHMPLFAFVSGYFNRKSKRTTQEKVIGILKIYLFAQLFYTIVNKVIFEETSSKLELFSPKWTMWYFVSLMSWYIISDFIKDKKKWFIISIALALYIGHDQSVGSYASISRTFFFLPYFILGMGFKEEYFEKLRRFKYVLAVTSVIFFAVLYYLSDSITVEMFFEYTKYSYYADTDVIPLYIRIFHYVGSFIVCAFILSIIPTVKTQLSIIGKNSIVLYVSHSFIVQLLYKYHFTNIETIFDILKCEFTILVFTITLSLLWSFFIGNYKLLYHKIKQFTLTRVLEK